LLAKARTIVPRILRVLAHLSAMLDEAANLPLGVLVFQSLLILRVLAVFLIVMTEYEKPR
jgi:hypothetical protein